MKVILSRKGMDSEAGGIPSPILPDGTLLSLPIPDNTSGQKYVKRQIVSGENGALFSTISPLNGILFSVTARSWRKKRHAVRRLIP